MYGRMVTTMTNALAKWLLEEIEARHMSIREFARFCGIGNQTLNNILDPSQADNEGPSLITLKRLATATKTDLCTLIGFVAPELTNVSPRAQLMADRIAKLPPEKQEIVDRYLLGTLFEEGNEGR